MANTFKVITRDVAPASAGSPETLYTVQTGSTIIVLGLTLANVHTAQVTGTVQLVSTTTQTSQTQIPRLILSRTYQCQLDHQLRLWLVTR